MLGEWFRALARNISKKAGDKKDKLRNYQVRDFIKDRKVDKKEDALKNMGVKNAEEVAEKDKSFNHKRIEFLKNKLKLEIASDRLKVLTLYVTSFIVDTIQAVIKMLIILLSNIYIVILLGAVVVVIALFSALAVIEEGKTTKPEQPQVSDQINQGQQGGSGASWTLEELATRGSLLSNYEKNLYRLVMLYKEHVTSNKMVYPEDTGDIMTAVTFATGLFAIESSAQFYQSGEDTKNILEVPTDKRGINSSGYTGNFQVHYTTNLGEWYGDQKLRYPSAYADALRSRYKPKVDENIERLDLYYIPYASAISVAEAHYKIKEQYIASDKIINEAYRIMDVFGIKENREELLTYLIWALAQAEYHGADAEEYPAYMAFWCAMYASTSDNDAERSMKKWGSTASSYSASATRKMVLGDKNFMFMDKYNSPEDINYSGSLGYLTLNGEPINTSLWDFLWKKYKNIPEFKKAWDLTVELASIHDDSNNGGGRCARVLNFVYGMNSYLQGNRIITNISGKLTGTPSNSNNSNNKIPSGSNAKIEAMIDMAYKMLGLPYKLGATTIILNPDGTYSGTFDCAYFTYYLFKQQGVTMSAWSYGQYWDKIGTFVDKKDIQRGDLIFFEKTYVPSQHRDPMITHVGIALGDGKMIHQGGTEVHISDLNDDYYTKHYHSAKRIPLN